tara:strand:- start:55332 stop:56024 length:693 start_codon:yes stop_codon:yes gene_type:complete
MARKKKSKNYFTLETQDAIIAYNKEEDSIKRNRIYNDGIKYPFEKLVENIIHRFKFYYFDYPFREVQHEVVSFLVEKMPKYAEGKGKAFSYFSIVAKNYLIHHNNGNYKLLKSRDEVSKIDTNRDINSEIQREAHLEETFLFMEEFIAYCEKDPKRIVTKERDLNILYALMEIFKKRSNLENFNKKAIYILVREMVNVKTQYITKVINVLKQKYILLHKEFLEHGTLKNQ